MKKLFKRIIPCLLIVFSVFAIVACKDNTYQYPSKAPLYTNGGIFAEIGDLKISNADIYNRLMQSYGLEEIENAIDAELLKDVVLTAEQEKDFQDQMTNLIYGTLELDELTAEEKADAEKAFELDMMSNGLTVDKNKKDSALYYENYYRLDYKRYVKTLEVLTKEIKEHDAELEEDEDPYFTDSSYVSYFNSNFHKTYKLIIVTFESSKEAKDVMAQVGINVDALTAGWTNAKGDKLTEAQVLKAFEEMYEIAYNKDFEGAKEYTYQDLLALKGSSSADGAMVSKANNLEAGEYTHGPVTYANRFFLMYAEEVGTKYIHSADEEFIIEDTDAYIADKDANNNVTELTEATKELLFSYLVEQEVGKSSSAYENNINRVMYELRQEAGLEIFAEGLENDYKSNYNSTFSALDITEYDEFNATTNVSDTEVAKWNGGSLTVEEMFDALTARYGAVITLLFVQQYIVLTSKHNTIVNYITGEKLDSEKYAELVEEDIDAYKESFEEGDFETYGFPASYGWENFVRDYLGLSNEAQIIVDFNSTLYNDVLALYTKALYMAEVGDVTLEVLTDSEGVKTWGLKSSKWALTHDTGVKVVDENKLPVVTLAYSEADIEGLPKTDENGKAIVYAKNDYYAHFILTTAEGKFLTNVTADQAVMEAYDDIYNETFSATASGVYAYFDKDLDGVADEVEEKDAALALELVNLIWDAARQESSEKKLGVNLTKVVRDYELSNPTSQYYKYKQAGLRLTVISGSTYSNTSSCDDAIKEVIQGMWADIVNYVDELGTSTTITGQDLDPLYRYIKNDKVYTVSAYRFADKYNPVYADNGYYQFAVTKATSRTSYEYKTSTKTQKPSLYIYEQYQLDSDDREITINCSSQLSTYYTPAMNRVGGSDVVNKSILSASKELLTSVKFTAKHNELHSALEFLINAALEELESK